MKSKVFFMDLRANSRRTVMQKYQDLISRLKPEAVIAGKDLTAVKLHFGEEGNLSFIRPPFVRPVVKTVRDLGGVPFLTDCNTLYVGSRSNSADHLSVAVKHGFGYAAMEAPVIIADGIYGGNHREVALNLPDCPVAYIGADIAAAEAIITLTHFKGHELTGFGGVLKNLGMGCAARAGKLFQHSNVSPTVRNNRCLGCGVCVKRCPAGAITLGDNPDREGKSKRIAVKDDSRCIGCGDCIIACNFGAMRLNFDAQSSEAMRRMVAHAKAALTGKENKSLHISFVTQVSPACDCNPFNDAPIVPDLGILAGLDPVAVDSAAVDLVNAAPVLHNSQLGQHCGKAGLDKFKTVYPNVDWEVQLDFAQEIGLGSRRYTLETVD
ncbi:MAG: DUF362 domain-containing protein [Desulfarculales bacterium]|jgi:uncharacterized Fe-S center protein|nr:DUF362 domain-containing protein [Desulfarculales bacterium]